jgi:lipid II isoglutaminyl synthase (glutamine-hydrolysing)
MLSPRTPLSTGYGRWAGSRVSNPSTGQRVGVVLIYQSLLGLYGDRGNATVLIKRLAWRGYEPVLTVVEPGDLLPNTGQIYLLGGGEDAAQVMAVRALKADGGLYRAVDRGAAVLAVCAGNQIVGKSFTVGYKEEVISGLGLLDVATTRGPMRAIGNCNDGTEGTVAGTVIGTYPHGQILARNPALADHVLELALGHELPPLVCPEIDKLRRQRLARVRRSNARRRTRSRPQTQQLASGSR